MPPAFGQAQQSNWADTATWGPPTVVLLAGANHTLPNPDLQTLGKNEVGAVSFYICMNMFACSFTETELNMRNSLLEKNKSVTIESLCKLEKHFPIR